MHRNLLTIRMLRLAGLAGFAALLVLCVNEHPCSAQYGHAHPAMRQYLFQQQLHMRQHLMQQQAIRHEQMMRAAAHQRLMHEQRVASQLHHTANLATVGRRARPKGMAQTAPAQPHHQGKMGPVHAPQQQRQHRECLGPQSDPNTACGSVRQPAQTPATDRNACGQELSPDQSRATGQGASGQPTTSTRQACRGQGCRPVQTPAPDSNATTCPASTGLATER